MTSLAERNARAICDLSRWEFVVTRTFTLIPHHPHLQDRFRYRWSAEDALEDPAMRRWEHYVQRHAA